MSATAAGLCTFVDASPSPFHVVGTVAAALEARGFTRFDEALPWPDAGGRHYVVRGGSIVAWAGHDDPTAAFRIVGGHTDSPNLRVKQNPDYTSAGLSMVGLEPYGGAWTNSWLDRDLGLSGRIVARSSEGLTETLVRIDEPILRVPQLAIHLSEDRSGVSPDRQRHLNAILHIGAGWSIRDVVAGAVEVDPDDILGWELMTHVLEPAAIVGAGEDMISAPRLDNQGTCYAGLQALLEAAETPGSAIPVLALFDHEEVGSGSDRGASSDLLATVLERICLARGGDREDFFVTMARSVCASGDMAHATHPNYPERHEPHHHIEMNGGPVLKVNQNLRYATDSVGAAEFALACEQAGVPLQRYVHRADLPCGSTIGPLTATRTGLSTVDVGAAQLAMHSSRELMGARDIAYYAASLREFLTPRR